MHPIATRRRALTGLLALALAAGALGCGDGRPLLVSEEDEIMIGKEVHAQITTETPLLMTPEVVTYVESLGATMVPLSPRAELAHHFYVLNSEQINAFAAPGGYIYVTVGLLRKVKSRAELAGVMGHEIGHVAGYHGARTMESAMLAGTLSQLIFGDVQILQQIADWVVGVYLQGAHSQDLELEADAFGVTLSHGAGYNPWGLVDFFQLIEELQGGSIDNFISDWLLSHPQPAERIRESSAMIEGLGVAREGSSLVVDNADPPYRPISELQALLPAPAANQPEGGGEGSGSGSGGGT